MAAELRPDNPYPGLRPFQADETHLFFGRDTQTAELLTRLQRARFLAIVGSSGSGKSSLVRAGLLQGLYGGLMAGGSQWRVVDLRPGTNPIGNLVAALDRPGALRDEGCPADESFTDATLRRSALGLVQAVREARLAPGERVLVLVDQFEELFRAMDADQGAQLDDDASAFIRLLLAAARQQELPIYVALTMRSDFLGECARFRDLPEAISDGQYLIPRLTRDQLREAITGPAAVHGVALSPTLVNRLLNDVGDNPDQLPILQHALMRTWDLWARNPDRRPLIDLPDYEHPRIGGMAQALSRHADEVLDSLGEGDAARGQRRRRIAERLFKALARIGAGGQAVRRFAPVREVADIAGAPLDEVIAVIEAFRAPGNSFLMPPVPEPLAADTTIDISHESLIRNWTTVRRWLAEEAESQRIYERLATTAALHAERQAGLWGQPDLGVALAWRERQGPTATWARRYSGRFEQAMGFLDDSHAQAVLHDRQRSGRRRSIAVLLFVSGLAMLALLISWAADEQARRSDLQAVVDRTLEDLSIVRRLKPLYTERLRSGAATDAACRELEKVVRERGPVYLTQTLDSLCKTSAGTRVPDLEAFLEVGELLINGHVGEAESRLVEAPEVVTTPGLSLMYDITNLHSPAIGRERRELMRLKEAVEARSAADDAPGAQPSAKSFVHPVHRAIAGKLLARPAQDLSPLEQLLFDAYRRLDADSDYRRSFVEDALGPDMAGAELEPEPEPEPAPEPGADTAYASAAASAADAASAPGLQGAAEPEPELELPESTPEQVFRFTYEPMVKAAALHASTGLEKVIDRAWTYSWSFLVLLAWPSWRLSRGWQRRRGKPIAPEPAALRRALALLYDLALAVGILLAVGQTSFSAAGMLAHGAAQEWGEWIGMLLTVLIPLGYLLLGDAIRLRHCRSFGKLAFDLRPVCVEGANAGHIGLLRSARRNVLAPLLAIVVLGIAAADTVDLEALLESLGGFAIFVLLALSWLAIGVMPGGRTLGDRLSGTRVIDADSAESLAIDRPSRYVDTAPVAKEPVALTTPVH